MIITLLSKLHFAYSVLGSENFAFSRKSGVVERFDIYVALDTRLIFNLLFIFRCIMLTAYFKARFLFLQHGIHFYLFFFIPFLALAGAWGIHETSRFTTVS
jgi:hypothetical protein